MIGDWTSAITNRHVNAPLRDRLSVTAMVPYVGIRVPLAANNSYSHLFVGWRILLREYTLMSAPVSSRKDASVALSVTKMRMEPMPSSSTAFTDGGPRFPASICTETDTCTPGLQTFGGSSRSRGFPISLSIFLLISAGYTFPLRVAA